ERPGPQACLVFLHKMVQIRQVRWVDVALVALQIVAVVVVLVDEEAFLWTVEKPVVGEQRRLAGTQVGEDDAGLLLAGIGEMADALVKGAADRFTGLLETPPAAVVEPAVVETAQPAVLQSAIAQISPAVRAVQAEESRPPVLGAKKDESLAHHTHR